MNRDFPHIDIQYGGGDKLYIAAVNGSGFDITVDASMQENTLCFGPWHDHFQPNDEGDRELLQLLGYGLSKLGRVKVINKGKRTVRSAFEVIDEKGEWIEHSETGLVVFNPLAKKSITYLQNDLIPVDAIRSNKASTTE